MYKKTEQTRKHHKISGVQVPPFMILSITSKCNLNCAGCYAGSTGTGMISRDDEKQLTKGQWHKIIKDASELGVFCFIIAGGEPFLFNGLLELCAEFKDNFFLIFTNGTAVNDDDIKKLKRMSNIGIIVSIEGGAVHTDARRGTGVYQKAMDTLNRLNYSYWLEQQHLDELLNMGVRIGVFIEYIPLSPINDEESFQMCSSPILSTCAISKDILKNIYAGSCGSDHGLILNPDERCRLRETMLEYRQTKPIYIVHSPGDEEYFGGCVSAGRGFAHVTPKGDLTPCPVSNIATHNLIKDSLRDGLASTLFKRICEDEHLLETDGLPCALFAHPKEVNELARSVGAYRTNI